MKIGMVVPDVPGHGNPGSSLGRILQDLHSDNEVIMIGLAATKAFADKAGLTFRSLGTEEEAAEIQELLSELGTMNGMKAFQKTVEIIGKVGEIFFRDLPGIVKELALDAMLIDEVNGEAMTVAEYLDIPFGILCNALPVVPDPWVPPIITTWIPRNSWWSVLRNRVANHLVFQVLASPLHRVDDVWRRQHGLPKISRNDKPTLFIVAQLPPHLDFPRRQTPDNFFRTRPFHTPHRDDDDPRRDDFPWDRLDPNRPLVYASMGTIQNGVGEIYRRLALAARSLESSDRPVQLVLALGRRNIDGDAHNTDGADLDGTVAEINAKRRSNGKQGDKYPTIITVEYAPQVAVLPKASLLITHAGQNTALEGVMAGLPMIAIPISNDQPGVASRLVHAGIAQLLSAKASPKRLRKAVRKGLTDPRYRESCQRMRERILDNSQTPTLEQVAQLIHSSFERNIGKPRNEWERLLPSDESVVEILGPGLANSYRDNGIYKSNKKPVTPHTTVSQDGEDAK
jgi:UDP:flavonoid glycosyltransferase YjiC (YdhE family)